MFGKQGERDELTRDGVAASEGKHKSEIVQNNSGKILIEVNVSKQNMHGDEIRQIIREIFDLNNRDLEVEKVVMPIGENTWQIRKTNPSKLEDAGSVEFLDSRMRDGRKPRLHQNRMKSAKRNLLCGVKMFQSLNRSRQNSRRKLARKRSDVMDLNKLDVAEVHSSPAITNLLSQLYPNPYDLLNLFETPDNSMDVRNILDSSDSCKIQFKANNVLSVKESIIEQETSSLCKSPTYTAPEVVRRNCDGGARTKTAIFGNVQTTDEPVQLTIPPMPEKVIPHKLKRKIVTEPVPAVLESESVKTNSSKFIEQEEVSVTGIRQRSKMTSTESKSPKKRIANVLNAAAERTKGEKAHSPKQRISPTAKEKLPLSTIHPMSFQKTTSSFGEKPEQVKSREHEKSDVAEKSSSKAKKKVLADKNKCIVKYLKLIKDMYEEEERQLQCQINDAWNFAIHQTEEPERKECELLSDRKDEQSFINTHGGVCGHHQYQVPGAKQKKTWDKVKKKPVCGAEVSELCTVPIPLRPAITNDSIEPSCSRITQIGDNLKIFSKNCPNFDSCNQSQCGVSRVIQTETYVLNKRKHIEQISEGLPVNVMNTVHETNRKIDLLIRQIDNSMNWLSRSEKTDSGSITCNRTAIEPAIEQAKGLSDQPEKNSRTRKPDNKTYCKGDPLLDRSYRSFHFIPMENGIGSFHISSDSLLNTRNQECLWHDMFRPTYLVNLLFKNNKEFPSNRSFNFLRYTSSGTTTYRSTENRRTERSLVNERNFTLRTEVPELVMAPPSTLISVESSNELGSFVENRDRSECESSDSFKNRKKRDNSKLSLAEVKTALETEELILNRSRSFGIGIERPFLTPLSINAVTSDESLSNLKPVVIQEITWNFYLPAPLPVTRVLYRNERNLVFTRMEASVFHVARNVSFLNLALMSVVQIIEQEPKQQSSIIISLHKCSSFVKNNNGLEESGKACKFVVLPSDVHFTEQSSGNIALSDDDFAEIKVLKKAEAGALKDDNQDVPFYWDSFPSESSTEIFDGNKPGIKRIETLLRGNSKNSLTWFHPLPDPYESNPDTNHADDSKHKNIRVFRTSPNKDEELPYTKGWNRGKTEFDGSSPPIFRYLSSETSDTSVDDQKSKRTKKTCNVDLPLFPEIKKSAENTDQKEEPPKETQIEEKPKAQTPHEEDNEDCSSTSSFKSSNDCSDANDVFDLGFPKKKAKRSHFLDMLFNELRSFRKSLAKRRGPKRRNIKEEQRESNEFQDALSELNEDEKKGREKQKVDEAVAVNTTCIDEIAIPASYAMPRKIFKTSFRGKESVTELMIDLKDVSISEVSDISVEKRKLSTDHTKISIVISKQGDKMCCASQADKPEDMCEESDVPSPEGSYHSLKPEKTNCLGWTKEEGNKSDEDIDDDDFKSVDSGKSLENMSIQKFDSEALDRSNAMEPQKKFTSYGKHKFDFYRKMDDGTSSFMDKEMFFSSKYGKQLAPLRKAITDMQVRVRNIQKNSFYTSDEYYERALRMAKMSAGYCQSCKSKAVIPEDPLGIYKKFIPRSCTRSPLGKQRKYYFRTTSSTNSSFYSIHSSNSDVSDKFCHLNASSSMVTNGLNRSHRSHVVRGSLDSSLPLFLGRTINF